MAVEVILMIFIGKVLKSQICLAPDLHESLIMSISITTCIDLFTLWADLKS